MLDAKFVYFVLKLNIVADLMQNCACSWRSNKVDILERHLLISYNCIGVKYLCQVKTVCRLYKRRILKVADAININKFLTVVGPLSKLISL